MKSIAKDTIYWWRSFITDAEKYSHKMMLRSIFLFDLRRKCEGKREREREKNTCKSKSKRLVILKCINQQNDQRRKEIWRPRVWLTSFFYIECCSLRRPTDKFLLITIFKMCRCLIFIMINQSKVHPFFFDFECKMILFPPKKKKKLFSTSKTRNVFFFLLFMKFWLILSIFFIIIITSVLYRSPPTQFRN